MLMKFKCQVIILSRLDSRQREFFIYFYTKFSFSIKSVIVS